MIIEKIDPTREAFSDYSFEGAVLTIAGIPVNLEEEQGDQEVIITFAACNGMVHRGMMPCCEYVADVLIPPRKYETVEVEGSASGISTGAASSGSGSGSGGEGGKADEEPETHTESVPIPLDLDSVTLKLWPIVDKSVTNHQQGEINVAE
jgi:hypothetical protein